MVNFFSYLERSYERTTVLIPDSMASSLASLLAIVRASDSLTSMVRSTLSLSKIFGRNSGDHLLIPGILEPSCGCVPTIWIVRILLFQISTYAHDCACCAHGRYESESLRRSCLAIFQDLWFCSACHSYQGWQTG